MLRNLGNWEIIRFYQDYFILLHRQVNRFTRMMKFHHLSDITSSLE